MVQNKMAVVVNAPLQTLLKKFVISLVSSCTYYFSFISHTYLRLEPQNHLLCKDISSSGLKNAKKSFMQFQKGNN